MVFLFPYTPFFPSRFLIVNCKIMGGAVLPVKKRIVNGEKRMGIFALKDIKANEELTFDYQFKRLPGRSKQKCHCGEENCRGYLSSKPVSRGKTKVQKAKPRIPPTARKTKQYGKSRQKVKQEKKKQASEKEESEDSQSSSTESDFPSLVDTLSSHRYLLDKIKIQNRKICLIRNIKKSIAVQEHRISSK